MTRGSKTGADRGEAGFTLLEVVIAMTLLAVLMLALSGSIGFVGRTWDRAWDRSAETGSLARVDEMARRSIENAFPAVIKAGGKERFLFTGTAQNLRLAAHDGGANGMAGYHTIEIGMASDGRAVVYRRAPLQAAGPMARLPETAADEAILLRGNFTFAFSYFGTPRPKMPPAWYDSWDHRDRLPDLVRLRILEEGREAWPPIVARMAINAEYACISGDGICRQQEITP